MRGNLQNIVSMAAVVALVSLVPLVILPGWSFYFDITPKVAVLLLATTLLAFTPSAWIGGLERLWADRLGRWFLILGGLQVASLTLSWLGSSAPDISFTGSTWRRFGWAVQVPLTGLSVMLCGWFAQRNDWTWPLRALVLAGFAASAYGIAQYAGVDPWLPGELYHIGEGEFEIVRPPGTLGHAGYFATYLSQVVFFALLLGRCDESAKWRWFGVAVAVVAAPAIVLSGTRGAVVGALAGGVVTVMFFRPRMRTLAVGAGAALLLGGAFLSLSDAGEKLRARMFWAREDVYGGARPWLWKDSLALLSDYPLTGAGLETFTFTYPRYQSKGAVAVNPDQYYESPHNIFADALASQGLLGIIPLLGWCVLGAASAWRSRGPEAGWLFAALVAGLVSNQFLSLTLSTALFFYLPIAALLGSSVGADPETSGHSPIYSRLLGIGLACLSLGFGWILVRADTSLLQTREALDSGQVRIGIERYLSFLEQRPAGMSADLWFTGAVVAAGSRGEDKIVAAQAAMAAAKRATLEAEDRQNAFLTLAMLQAQGGDPEPIEQSLRSAIDAAPNWYKPRAALFRLLLRLGRRDEAIEQGRRAAELAAGRYPELEAEFQSVAGEQE